MSVDVPRPLRSLIFGPSLPPPTLFDPHGADHGQRAFAGLRSPTMRGAEWCGIALRNAMVLLAAREAWFLGRAGSRMA